MGVGENEAAASRVSMLPRADSLAAAEAAGVPTPLAELNIFRVLLQHPLLAKAASDLLLALLFRSSLDHRLRELVIMRIGWATGSAYEWTQHWRIAQEQFACSADDLLALRDWRSSQRFGDSERTVLAATDEILETGTLAPASFEQCRSILGSEVECLELVASVATWHWISQLTRSLDIPLEAGVEAWPPDGRAPDAPHRPDS